MATKAYQLPPLVPLTDATECGLLPTLTVNGNYNRKGASKNSGNGLIPALKRLATLTARDWRSHKRIKIEKRSFRRRQLNEQIGGPLNPMWCEWYMGYPPEWTALEHSETPSSRK